MSNSIEQVRAVAFGENVHHLAQQRPARFMPWVTEGQPTNSKYKTFARLGSFELQEITVRHGDTMLLSEDWSRRVAFKGDYGGALPLDDEDDLENILNPMSEYAIAGRSALNRKWDDVIINAVRGSAAEGETGTNLVPLPATQKETVVSGLTLAKILNGQKLMRDVDLEISPDNTVLVISPAALVHVLSEADRVFTSRDFNPLSPLTTGGIASYLGMTWVVSTRLPIISGTIRGCYIWQRNAIGFASWRKVYTSMNRRTDKNDMMQLLIKTHIGAVRIEDSLVVELQVTE